MTLNHSGTTGTMCSDQNLNFLATECTKTPGSSKGCTTTYAYVCNVGVNTKKYTNVKPYQKTGFQPVVTLTSGSTLSQCTTGQVLQESIHSGTTPAANPKIIPTSYTGLQTIGGRQIFIDNSASNPFPQIGATSTGTTQKYGGDNYSNPAATDVLFSYDSGTRTLSWWDNTDQSKDHQGEAATWHYKFISFVMGSGGTEPNCACAFDINVAWSANNNNPTTTYTQDATHSAHCTW